MLVQPFQMVQYHNNNMNPLRTQIIKTLVGSDAWKVLREDIINPFLIETKDVTTPMEVGGEVLRGADAYNAKYNTVLLLAKLIHRIEKTGIIKNATVKLRDKRDSCK